MSLRPRAASTDRETHAFARHHPPHHADTVACAAGLDRAGRRERPVVDPARGDRDLAGGDPHRPQLERLVRAGGDHRVHVLTEPGLEVHPVGGAGVGETLLASLHHPERVVGVHDRDAGLGQRAGRLGRGQTGHPEVAVHQIGSLLLPGRGQPGRHGRDERQQLVLGQVLSRSRIQVTDQDPGRQRHGRGQVGVVPTGEHGHLVPPVGELASQSGHVHVLPTGVHAAQNGQRAGVF
jgi:hypothetical protein